MARLPGRVGLGVGLARGTCSTHFSDFSRFFRCGIGIRTGIRHRFRLEREEGP